MTPPPTPALSGVAVREGQSCAVGINGEVAKWRDGTWSLLDTGLGLARDFHAVWIDERGGVWNKCQHDA